MNKASEKCLAALVIVLYGTDPEAAAKAASQWLDDRFFVIWVDNTPGRNEKDQPTALGDDMAYIPLGQNLGIAAALNRGIEYAGQLRLDLVFTFDQDSRYSVPLLEGLMEAFTRLRPSCPDGLAVGPLPRHKDSGASYLRRRDRLRLGTLALFGSRPTLLRVGELITSGLLSDMATYRRVGLYREDLFIDFVDYEWCWRLRRQGGCCAVGVQTCLPHLVGQGEVRFTLGMKRGAPQRLYYLFRNGLYLALSGKMPLYDAIKFVALIPAKLAVFSLFFQDRAERVRYALQGLSAGVRWALGRGSS